MYFFLGEGNGAVGCMCTEFISERKKNNLNCCISYFLLIQFSVKYDMDPWAMFWLPNNKPQQQSLVQAKKGGDLVNNASLNLPTWFSQYSYHVRNDFNENKNDDIDDDISVIVERALNRRSCSLSIYHGMEAVVPYFDLSQRSGGQC